MCISHHPAGQPVAAAMLEEKMWKHKPLLRPRLELGIPSYPPHSFVQSKLQDQPRGYRLPSYPFHARSCKDDRYIGRQRIGISFASNVPQKLRSFKNDNIMQLLTIITNLYNYMCQVLFKALSLYISSFNLYENSVKQIILLSPYYK